MTRHQKRDRRARVRSKYLEDVRVGRAVTPPASPLFTPLQQKCFFAGMTRRETRIAEQQALRGRMGLQ